MCEFLAAFGYSGKLLGLIATTNRVQKLFEIGVVPGTQVTLGILSVVLMSGLKEL